MVRLCSLSYIAVVALAVICGIIVASWVPYGSKSPSFVGCYLYDALLIGFGCQNFFGSGLVEFWLNFPLLLSIVFMPFAVHLSLIGWVPILLYLVALRRLRQLHTKTE